MKKLLLISLLTLSGLLSTTAHAESTFVPAAVLGSTAQARVDFSITIPQVLYLRVGTSSGIAATDGTINSIDFTIPAANVGDGTNFPAVGGDLSAGAVTVRVYGNGGNISLNSTTTGLMTNVAGDTIPWSQISVAAAPLASGTAGFTNAAITHPAFNATFGLGTATVLTATAKVVRVEGKWTYSFLNSIPFAPGVYGTSARNGRVAYIATQL